MKKIQAPKRTPKEERRCRAVKPRRFVFAACIVCIAVLCMGALAEGGKGMQEETVVSLVWKGSDTGINTAEWNERAVQIHTEDVGLGNGKIYDFVGVTLFDLMKLAGADECTKAIVKSTDGLVGEVSAEDRKGGQNLHWHLWQQCGIITARESNSCISNSISVEPTTFEIAEGL